MTHRSPQASTEPSLAAPNALGERRAASLGPYPARGLVGGARGASDSCHIRSGDARPPRAPAHQLRRGERLRPGGGARARRACAGTLIWGTDTSAFYRDIARLSELPPGTSVLDIPCGGVAFRASRRSGSSITSRPTSPPSCSGAPAPRPTAVAFTGWAF